MKKRWPFWAAACLCSTMMLTGCSADRLMDRLMGNPNSVSASEPVDIVDGENVTKVDSSLEKPVFTVNPAESVQYEVGGDADPLSVEASLTGEGTITYQWYKNNVNANGGGTAIEGAVESSCVPDTDTEGIMYYYAVATNTVGKSVSMTTSAVAEVKIIPAGEWVQNETGWWYKNNDGSYPAAAWKKIKGEWYAFNDAGYMRTGWFKEGNTWYYLNSDGKMQTGWIEVDGERYLMKESGAMRTGWYLDEDANIWYYFAHSGKLCHSGWVKVDGSWYYMDADGKMQTGWIQDGDAWYYLNPDNGKMAHDTTVDGHQVDGSGKRVS